MAFICVGKLYLTLADASLGPNQALRGAHQVDSVGIWGRGLRRPDSAEGVGDRARGSPCAPTRQPLGFD
jgi:hypothetical protein